MQYIRTIILLSFALAAMTHAVKGQGFERYLYDIQAANMVTAATEGTLLVNSTTNQFHRIGLHGEILEHVHHPNHQHPDDVHPGVALVDLAPNSLANGDVVFLAKKEIDPVLGKSDVLYFNLRDNSTNLFTVQTTLFLPEYLDEIDEAGRTVLQSHLLLDNHIYAAGLFTTLSGANYPVLLKINLTGEIVWSNTYLLPYSIDGRINAIKALTVSSSNRVLLAIEYDDFEYYHLEVDADGQNAGGIYFPLSDDLAPLESPEKVAYFIQPDGGLIIIGPSANPGDDDLYLFDTDANLTFSRQWMLGPVNMAQLYNIVHQIGDDFIVYFPGFNPPPNPQQHSLTISRISLAGDIVWIKDFALSHSFTVEDVAILDQEQIVFGFAMAEVNTEISFSEYDFFFGALLKLGPNGTIYDSQFQGQTFEDIDQDCAQLVEAPLGGWLVAFESEIDTFYALSNDAAEYTREVYPGNYTGKLYPPSQYWAACPAVPNLSINAEDTIVHNFSADAAISCPNLVAHISAPFLRRCFSSVYSVNYCNTGTELAPDAYLEVDLDPALTFINASIPVSSIQGQRIRFDIGDIDVGQCGAFQITVEVGCDGVLLGQTHCTTATIYPNAPCVIPSSWSGASLEVAGRCEQDSVAFVVQNTGSNTTSQVVRYLVIEDQVILFQGEGDNLPPGDSLVIRYPATGVTYRIEVEQEPDHPGQSFPTASIEGCASQEDAPISLGYITQYWEDDADHFVSVDCQENIGAYDPNDKRAFPSGVAIGGTNYLEPNLVINYHIRFQNTGTDTAFTVVIKDRISNQLDITSLQLGAASHDYQMEISPLRELIFTFANINLVDSFANEPLSHGFVSFSIAQLPDLPEGTEIHNQADIFFDFNHPIRTNTWSHEIKQNILPINMEPPSPPDGLQSQLLISPNPVTEMASIEILGNYPPDQLKLQVFDSKGVYYTSLAVENNQAQFTRGSLPAGIYFLELTQGDRTRERTKLIIQR